MLVVMALAVGAAFGYLANTSPSHTTTETVVSTYTVSLPYSGSLACVVTRYSVWMYGVVNGSATSYGLTTQTYDLQTYTTTTPVIEKTGYATTTTNEFTGSTITGAVDEGNYTTCTYVPG